jgi:hypothetical protein
VWRAGRRVRVLVVFFDILNLLVKKYPHADYFKKAEHVQDRPQGSVLDMPSFVANERVDPNRVLHCPLRT